MTQKKNNHLIFQLIFGVIVGISIGLISNSLIINIIQSIKHILSQFIFFIVPLIILGFITPAITEMKQNAGRMLSYVLILAYLSSIGAALMAMYAGYAIIPQLHIISSVTGLKELPPMLFVFDIPPLFSVLSALCLSLCLGISINYTHASSFVVLLQEFQKIMLFLVEKTVIPILPFFISTTFAVLAYEGSLSAHLPIFAKIIVIVLIGHYLWLTLLYTIAAIVSGKNPLLLLKHYIPVYITALGTMSSAATLPIALSAAKEAKIMEEEIVDFVIPLGATVHLCGSVLTEVFFIMTVSQIIYGTLPDPKTMILFIILLGIFAIGAPGVPGGTLVASLGLISSVLGFNSTAIALILTIFALQDSFGTACNITGDGALALILDGVLKKKRPS